MKNSVIPIIGEISFRTDCISEKMTGDGSLLIPMCKNSKLKATTTTTISNSDNLSLGVSSLAS